MTTERKPKSKLVFLLDVSEDHSYGYHYLKANVRVGKEQTFSDKAPEYQGLDDYVDELHDFEINAQCDDSTAKEGRGLYGAQPEFKFYRTRLREAERAVKVLRRFETKMRKLRELYDYPRDFSEYVMHAATALKIERFAVFSEAGANGRRFIEWTNREGFRNAIERAERKWIKQYKPAETEVVSVEAV